MIYQIIQGLHSMLELIFQIYCSYMTLLCFSMNSICYDRATYLSLIFKSILYGRLINSL